MNIVNVYILSNEDKPRILYDYQNNDKKSLWGRFAGLFSSQVDVDPYLSSAHFLLSLKYQASFPKQHDKKYYYANKQADRTYVLITDEKNNLADSLLSEIATLNQGQSQSAEIKKIISSFEKAEMLRTTRKEEPSQSMLRAHR